MLLGRHACGCASAPPGLPAASEAAEASQGWWRWEGGLRPGAGSPKDRLLTLQGKDGTVVSGREGPPAAPLEGARALGKERPALSACNPLNLVGDQPRLRHWQHHLCETLGRRGEHGLLHSEQGAKGTSPAWTQDTRKERRGRTRLWVLPGGKGAAGTERSSREMDARERQEKTESQLVSGGDGGQGDRRAEGGGGRSRQPPRSGFVSSRPEGHWD